MPEFDYAFISYPAALNSETIPNHYLHISNPLFLIFKAILGNSTLQYVNFTSRRLGALTEREIRFGQFRMGNIGAATERLRSGWAVCNPDRSEYEYGKFLIC